MPIKDSPTAVWQDMGGQAPSSEGETKQARARARRGFTSLAAARLEFRLLLSSKVLHFSHFAPAMAGLPAITTIGPRGLSHSVGAS